MSKNNIIIFIFAIACMAMIVTFVTSTTYTQLAIAALFYPPLVFVAFKLFPKKSTPAQLVQTPTTNPAVTVTPTQNTSSSGREGVDIVDIDKRAFLKVIGAAGLSFFLYSIFLRRTENLLFSRITEPETVSLHDATHKTADQTDVQVTNGFRISEIDEGDLSYYGFTNTEGSWYIMKEDASNGSFRYAKGVENFSKNWEDRASIKYDYFHKVFK